MLRFLAAAINAFTVESRAWYGEANGLPAMRRCNEAIHYLSGHLRDLCDSAEPLTESRADGIAEQLAFIPGQLPHILRHSPLAPTNG